MINIKRRSGGSQRLFTKPDNIQAAFAAFEWGAWVDGRFVPRNLKALVSYKQRRSIVVELHPVS